MKISIIGAGNVGGLTAMRISESNLADVFLVDINENLAKAKAFDIEDGSFFSFNNKKIIATADFSQISDSDIVIITAGFARQIGMSREDLLKKNFNIVKEIANKIKLYCPNCIIIVVTNPVDIMSYVVLKETGFKRKKVFGMGASLDSWRFSNLISKRLAVSISKAKGLVIGAHGDKMLPLPRLSKVNNRPLDKILSKQQIAELVDMAKNRGSEIVSLYGSGSAYFAPSRAILAICQAIIYNRDSKIPISAYLDGEFGVKDVCIGVLAKIDKDGIHQIVDLKLKEDEQKLFLEAVSSLKQNIRLLYPH